MVKPLEKIFLTMLPLFLSNFISLVELDLLTTRKEDFQGKTLCSVVMHLLLGNLMSWGQIVPRGLSMSTHESQPSTYDSWTLWRVQAIRKIQEGQEDAED